MTFTETMPMLSSALIEAKPSSTYPGVSEKKYFFYRKEGIFNLISITSRHVFMICVSNSHKITYLYQASEEEKNTQLLN